MLIQIGGTESIMNTFKKLILAAAFFSVLFIGASAEEIITYPTGTMFVSEGTAIDGEPEESISLFSTQPLEDYLIEQCMNHTESIDITSYFIPVSELGEVYFSFATRHPELLIRTGTGYNYYENTNTIAYIQPYYIFSSAEEDEEARAFMQEKLNEYVELASQFEKPLDKLLAVHDKMVEKYKYDSSATTDDILPFHAYGIFTNNTAVCQGYAQAFYMITRELGIEADFCRSDSINHIWNYLKLDGKWYHVDVTWDDPIIRDSSTGNIIEQTEAYHKNFLISDETRFQNIISKYTQAEDDWITYLDALPTCGNDFESTYLFNIHLPFTTAYDGEYFYAPCKSSVTYRSKNLKSGIIAASAPVLQNNGCTIYYYGLSDYDGELTPIAVNSINGQYSSFKKHNALNLKKNSTYGVPIYCDTSANSTDIFIWDMNTLTPACDKISIN